MTNGYAEALDGSRIGKQENDVLTLMGDGAYRTLREISTFLGHPEASVSARLRSLRRRGMIVNTRRIADPMRGLFSYQVLKVDAVVVPERW